MTLPPKVWRKRHLASQIVVARCVLHLRLAGFEVFDLAQPIEDQDRDEKRIPDSGDTLVAGLGRVECKGRNLDFPPFPYDTILLGETHQFEGKPYELHGIMVVPRAQDGFLWVSAQTRDSWVVESVHDPVHGHQIEAFACPRDLARWSPFRR